MIHRLNFILRVGVYSWSEQWYADAADADTAAYFTTLQLRKFLSPRGPGVILSSIRASNVQTPRLTGVRVYNLARLPFSAGGNPATVDTPGAAVIGVGKCAGGRNRTVEVRGLIDNYSKRDAFGDWNPGDATVMGLDDYLQFVTGQRLMGRFISLDMGAHPFRKIVSLAPGQSDPRTTDIVYLGDSLVGKSTVVVTGINRSDFPGLKGNLPILFATDTTVTVPIAWRNIATLVNPPRGRIRDVAFDYQRLLDIKWTDIRTKKVAAPSLRVRGKRSRTQYSYK